MLALEGPDGTVAELEYDAELGALSCDRRRVRADVPEVFAGVARMPLAPAAELELTILLDGESIEVFAEDGTRVLTDRVEPLRDARLRIRGVGGAVDVASLVVEAARLPEGLPE